MFERADRIKSKPGKSCDIVLLQWSSGSRDFLCCFANYVWLAFIIGLCLCIDVSAVCGVSGAAKYPFAHLIVPTVTVMPKHRFTFPGMNQAAQDVSQIRYQYLVA